MTGATGTAVIRSGVALPFSQEMTVVGGKHSLRLFLVSLVSHFAVSDDFICVHNV